MTDKEIEELVAAFRQGVGHQLAIYHDAEVMAFLFQPSSGNIYIFTDELDIDEKFRKPFRK
jgi:hypothetical protein